MFKGPYTYNKTRLNVKTRKYLNDYLEKSFDNLEAFNGKTTMTKEQVMRATSGLQTEFSSPFIHPGEKPQGDAANYNLIIRRNTVNIASDLDIAILGFANIQNGYQGFVLPATGGTVALTGTIYNTLPDRYRFTHVVGANTDTVDIFCNEIPYPAFVQNSGLDMYQINNIRYSISAAAAQDQFSNRFEIRKSSIFGLEAKQTLTPITFRDPKDEQTTIIDMPIRQPMDKETFIVHPITNTGGALFEVTLSMFIQHFFKYNSNNIFARG